MLRLPHLDCSCPLLLLEVDVAHVHTESAAERILLVLDDLCIDRQRLKPSGRVKSLSGAMGLQPTSRQALDS